MVILSSQRHFCFWILFALLGEETVLSKDLLLDDDLDFNDNLDALVGFWFYYFLYRSR